MKKKIINIIGIFMIVAIIVLGMYFFFKNNMNTSSNKIDLSETNAKADEADEEHMDVGDYISGTNMTEMYTARSDTYCAGHFWALTLRTQYGEKGIFVPDGGYNPGKQLTRYTKKYTRKIEQSIAYARWQWGDTSQEEFQEIVWASDQWKTYNGGLSNIVLEQPGDSFSVGATVGGRAQQFANFEYLVLKNKDEFAINATPSDPKDLNIVVEQKPNASYTQGPYQISFDGYRDTIKFGNISYGELVWNEIAGVNNGQKANNTFCKGEMSVTVTYEDGTTADKVAEILNDAGASFGYNFPKFGTNFYVKVDTSIGEKRIVKIEPKIQIKFIKKIQGDAYIWYSSEVTVDMTHDEAGILTDEMKSGAYCGGNFLLSDLGGDKLLFKKVQSMTISAPEGIETHLGLDNITTVFEGAIKTIIPKKLNGSDAQR